MKNIVSFFSQINDFPVTHLSDIEPLVYESTSTIKFLVARPAQEVCDLKKYVLIYIYRYCFLSKIFPEWLFFALISMPDEQGWRIRESFGVPRCILGLIRRFSFLLERKSLGVFLPNLAMISFSFWVLFGKKSDRLWVCLVHQPWCLGLQALKIILVSSANLPSCIHRALVN